MRKSYIFGDEETSLNTIISKFHARSFKTQSPPLLSWHLQQKLRSSNWHQTFYIFLHSPKKHPEVKRSAWPDRCLGRALGSQCKVFFLKLNYVMFISTESQAPCEAESLLDSKPAKTVACSGSKAIQWGKKQLLAVSKFYKTSHQSLKGLNLSLRHWSLPAQAHKKSRWHSRLKKLLDVLAIPKKMIFPKCFRFSPCLSLFFLLTPGTLAAWARSPWDSSGSWSSHLRLSVQSAWPFQEVLGLPKSGALLREECSRGAGPAKPCYDV